MCTYQTTTLPAAKANLDPGRVDPIKAVATTIAANILRPRVMSHFGIQYAPDVSSFRFERPNIRKDDPQPSNC